MIKNNSSISDILEFLNLPIDTVIFFDKESDKYKNYNGICVYLYYSSIDRIKLYEIIVEKHNSGNIKIHNKNNPARICFYANHIEVLYYINNNIWRVNKPARITYNYDGLIIIEYYYLKGKRHNSVGPAYRSYYDRRWHNYFYINGIEFSRDEFFERMDRINDKKQ